MRNFHKFMEDEMGGGTAPPVPGSDDQDTHDDSSVLDKELDIDPEARKEADASTTFTCHAVIDFPEHGLKAMPPTEITAFPMEDGNFEITVLYDGGTNSQKLQDMDGNDYEGEIKDLKRIVSRAFLEFLKSHAWKTVGMGGGMDPMGGGMPPPMGGAMGGRMGGMGGMAPMDAVPPTLVAHTQYQCLGFSKWMHLKETGTSTGDVAGFQRITIPLVRRLYPNEITFKTKKKKP